jgi:hypothetical protein
MLQFLCLPNGKNSKFKSRDSAPCNYWTWLCFAAQPHRVTICGCLLPTTTKANHTLWTKLLARLTFFVFVFFSSLKEWKLATVHSCSCVSRVPKLNGFKYWKISSKVLRRRIVWLVAKTHVARQTNVAAASCCKLAPHSQQIGGSTGSRMPWEGQVQDSNILHGSISSLHWKNPTEIQRLDC